MENLYLDLIDFYGFHVGKYASPMDASWALGCPKEGSNPDLSPTNFGTKMLIICDVFCPPSVHLKDPRIVSDFVRNLCV